jgi:hypothetical protein
MKKILHMQIRSRLTSILLVATLTCCNFYQESIDSRPEKIFLVLVDLSESVNDPAIKSGLKKDFKAILDKICSKDVLLAGFITESSITEHAIPIRIDFPSFRPTTDNELYLKAEKEEFDRKFTAMKDSLYSYADMILFGSIRKVMNTDIFSSLLFAEKVFNNYPKKEKVLIILSDMIVCSGKINFEKEKLTDQRVETILTDLAKTHQLPDLKGVNIYISGAHSRNATMFVEIQHFWQKYFEACKTRLNPSNYGATLIFFDE